MTSSCSGSVFLVIVMTQNGLLSCFKSLAVCRVFVVSFFLISFHLSAILSIITIFKNQPSFLQTTMKCPYCSHTETRVIDKRDSQSQDTTRRRRECLQETCSKRFTTYEHVEMADLYVIKKNGEREKFDPEKLRRGIERACEKRPVNAEQVNELVEQVHAHLLKASLTEIKSTVIGELVMRLLEKTDKVAYIRFASVYRDFADITSFKEELDKLLHKGSEQGISTLQGGRKE